MQVVILCGGQGKRLLPLTKLIPKPMALVNSKPFLSDSTMLEWREWRY